MLYVASWMLFSKACIILKTCFAHLFAMRASSLFMEGSPSVYMYLQPGMQISLFTAPRAAGRCLLEAYSALPAKPPLLRGHWLVTSSCKQAWVLAAEASPKG